MKLEPAEINRYDRHLRLKNVGMTGQLKLKKSRVLLIGAGGLGSPAALYLAAAGVGQIGIVDFDVVSISNLQRQILFRTKDEGLSKVECAKKELESLNPHIKINAYNEPLSSENALNIFDHYDYVVDAVDNFATRYLINDACKIAKKINIHGSVQGFEGRVSVFCHEDGPCYRCMFPVRPEATKVPSCSEAGVLGAIPGTVGTLMATETIKMILGIGKPLIGRLLIVDALEGTTESFKINKNRNCLNCMENPEITDLSEHKSNTFEGSYPMSQSSNSSEIINAADLKETLKESSNEMTLIDVRNPDELIQTPKIDGAIPIPLPEIESRVSEIDKSKPVIVYCHAGTRGNAALKILQEAGFKNVKNLAGGITAWNSH